MTLPKEKQGKKKPKDAKDEARVFWAVKHFSHGEFRRYTTESSIWNARKARCSQCKVVRLVISESHDDQT
jgi:hypothetical protein